MTTSSELLANGVPKPIPTPTTRLENRRRALQLAGDLTNRDDVVRLAGEFAAFLDEHPTTVGLQPTKGIPPVVLAEMEAHRDGVEDGEAGKQLPGGYTLMLLAEIRRQSLAYIGDLGPADVVVLAALALLALEA